MKKFTLIDVQGNQRFESLTQGQQVFIDIVICHCNQEQSIPAGIVEARREILHTSFDRQAVRDFCDLLPMYDEKNEFLNQAMVVMIETISRDYVRDYMVADMVKAMELRIKHYEGDVERAIDDIERYYTSGKVVPFAQTWKEAVEEIENGKVMFYEPSARAI